MSRAQRPRGRRAPAVVAATAGAVLALAAPAHAAPVTIDFEGATANEPITTQYGPPGGTPAGPEFKPGNEAGFTGLNCGSPHASASGTAHSGSKSILLDGCPGGEFYPSATFFHLGYSTDSVDFWVAAGSGVEIWSTAFKGTSMVKQVQTVLSGSGYQHVTLQTAGNEIDNVAIEMGSKTFPNPGSPTGVNLAFGNTLLRVDDLTYDPPSSPPESSFLLGSNHPSTAVTPGQKVEVKIPVTWSNNPTPALSPVELEASTPAGVSASFEPNPTTTLTSTLTLTAAKSAPAGVNTVTVDGYVDKGLGTEKHASTQIQLKTETPFFVSNPGALSFAPCTPRQIAVQVPTAGNFSDPLTIDVRSLQPSVKILGISPGELLASDHATATVFQQNGTASATVTLFTSPGTKPASAKSLVVTASSSGYADQTASGSLAVEAGSVSKLLASGTNITPSSVSTPQIGIPGTKLTLEGTGFCPNTKVGIGDPNQPATPESIGSDGKSLTFRVPRSAMTGKVKVLPPSGDAFDGPSVPVKSFRNTFGFSWVNDDYGLRMNGEMVDELVGQDEANINVFGWLVRKPEASLFEFIANKFIPNGICFGIAYSSQEFREFPQELSTFPHTGGTDPWHLDGVISPSAPLLRYVTERFSVQFTDQVVPIITGQLLGQAVNAHPANEDLTMIESELAKGRPVLIGLLSFSPFGGHTVLAYDTEPLGDGTTAVLVANSNAPYRVSEEGNPGFHDESEFTNSRILIDESGHWTFKEQGWDGPDSNLFVFKHDDLPILNGKRPKLPNVFTAAVVGGVSWIAFGSSGDRVTQVSDDHGGDLLKGGNVAPASRWPKGVGPIPNFSGGPGPLQMFSAEPKRAGPITATVKRGAKGGAMSMNLSGLQASIDAQSDPGQVDHVGVDPGGRFVSYQAGAGSTPYEATLLAAPGRGAARGSASSPELSEHLVKVGATAGGSGSERLSFQGGQDFALRHDGPSGQVSLTLSGFGKRGQPVAVKLPKIRVSHGEAIRVEPLRWGALGSSPVRIRTTIAGRSRSRLVRGRRLGRPFATVRVAKLRAGKGGVSLKLRLRHPSADDWISPAVTVLRGGHAIARSAPAQLLGRDLRAGAVKLKLSRALPRGSYTLRVRLLEVTADGPVQGSTVVSRILHAAAH
jgi:hypothetical protein